MTSKRSNIYNRCYKKKYDSRGVEHIHHIDRHKIKKDAFLLMHLLINKLIKYDEKHLCHAMLMLPYP